MSFGEAIKSVFSKYATFSGRARRSEFWYFFLFSFLVSLGLSIIPFLSLLSPLWTLAILSPTLAVTVRRFHDIGKSGWYYLIYIIPALLTLGCFTYIMAQIIPVVFNAAAGSSFFTNMEAIDEITEEIMASGIVESLMGAFFALLILGLVTFITWIIWIVWMAKDSEPGTNKWGPNPKEVTVEP